MLKDIPFNKPHLTGKEIDYVNDAFKRGKFSGNGYYTEKCHEFFEKKYGFRKCFLTTSGTDALEMAAILLDIQEGDEVILPSFTFVSTANAFALRGAKLLFADSNTDNPNIDPEEIRKLITPKTKAIVVVHYAGIACDMEAIVDIVKDNNVSLVEDAAHCIDAYFNERPLGSIGDLAIFSFHETKAISSGEGGMLVVNQEQFVERAEIVWEKGTNRAAFFRGEVNKYQWLDLGSSFLPSEITAAFLFAQLEHLDDILGKRIRLWKAYFENFEALENSGKAQRPYLPAYATTNGFLFYLICSTTEERDHLIDYMKTKKIHAVFHYFSLHISPYYKDKGVQKTLANSENFSDKVIRLPLFYSLEDRDQKRVIDVVHNFYSK